MGQEKSLQRAWAFEHLPQDRNWANNGPKRKEPAKGLNELKWCNAPLLQKA
jgi:hypothetical protein